MTDPRVRAGDGKAPSGANTGGSVSRRRFLSELLVGGASFLVLGERALADAEFLRATTVDDPFAYYPNRDWESVYRNLYHSDSSFVFLCAPNDTHNCLLRAHVKNGVVTRIAPTYGFQHATDLHGNKAGQRWDPRCCQKGLALVRRFYGDRRCKRPLVRRGFKEWIDAGLPRDPETGAVDPRYLRRGQEPWVPVTWDEAFALSARALVDIAETYSGEAGKKRLLAQGYDPLMVEATEGIGTQVMKFRGGMPPLGMTRVFAQYRIANAMALLDDKIRGLGAEGSVGARGWDNYSWHTDLPPGHPMVTGQQTIDFDLCNVEHAGLAVVWGMNWITTKMPDSHWLTEARMKGTRVVVIAAEYSATACKADEVIVVRPGTTPALALGLAQVLISERLYDPHYVRGNTDLAHLVRLDTGELLRAADIVPHYEPAALTNHIQITKPGESAPPIHAQATPVLADAKRREWGDFVVWDGAKNRPAVVNRDQVDRAFAETGIEPRLEGEWTVPLVDGRRVQCATVLSLTRRHLDAVYTPEEVEKITWAPAPAIRSLARQIADNMEATLFVMGMGPNQFFNSDLKDRAVFLVAALTRNVGRIGGNVGSYAGNYRVFFNGLNQYIGEDPFDVEMDPTLPARSRVRWRPESVHYFNHGDTILRIGNAMLTGRTHLPTPTKSIHVSNSNSLIGNAKGHYDSIVNTFPRVEFIAINEWWWTASCEYSDVVFPVDSWAELKYPDMSVSATNPFLYVFPATPLPRIHDTRSDVEVAAGICRAVGAETKDVRHDAYWAFVENGTMRPYIQRILDHSNATRGHRIEDLEAKAGEGIPAVIETRTYPKIGGWEQAHESKPWWTKTGRLEFYREEPEFQDSGENLVVHREPIDSTFFEPNVIVADKSHPLMRPKTPEDYGVDRGDLSADLRQARHVVVDVDELLQSAHPLREDGYRFIFHTPKYRHGAHTTAVDTDVVAIWFGPFGDMYREDSRIPFINEMYLDINPVDARELGVEDGDYVWIDADPHDRPFRNWQNNPEWYKVARLMARARYYPGTPRGVTRMWHNMYGATAGSVRGTEENTNGLAKSPDTGYQSLFRRGSHQSCTRGWLKPTWMTDTLTVKGLLGQQMTQGFVPDVHCPTGAPRESIVKISFAEVGGYGGERLWRPARMRMRPGYESDLLNEFIGGAFCRAGRA
ncbi:MAG: molybdopterin-dependent oxidoreductase [Candidatus Eisenbacteria bacterium]|uniref:Molybdopterin-dependent oxidoreductase n=1 Tax=Eiseniibacteriota bacterium TaxID=2212470 RepID=A0A956NAZ2_UNCEI|nr:molybdopterin-dependent oxidoreductase [Candidatus Eisenbacteria bacterium]